MKKATAAQRQLFTQLGKLTTERRNSRSASIDRMRVHGILKVINSEDHKVASAVRKEIPKIARAVDLITSSLGNGGRLIYVGAGTSGRLGVLDAAECPPTFGTDPLLIRSIMAGGKASVFRSREGAEDRAEKGSAEIRRIRVGRRDIVCGIAASLRTPFVISALGEAKKRGARTILVTTNPAKLLRTRAFSGLKRDIDLVISPDVGPEVVMGSTRMKSATAQKMVLNMLTTASMIRLGKVYENMMVDLKMNSRKLEERARRVLMIATGAGYDEASDALTRAAGHVKTAIVMLRTGLGRRGAAVRLKEAGGFVHRAVSRRRADRKTGPASGHTSKRTSRKPARRQRRSG
jgi:N-acetylmuramic acid 6-phosphate etherase